VHEIFTRRVPRLAVVPRVEGVLEGVLLAAPPRRQRRPLPSPLQPAWVVVVVAAAVVCSVG